ncbi:MAG: proton-conducting transporter membrane subunit, partial [Phycisphaerae bacterium]
MYIALVILGPLAAILALAIPSNSWRPWLLPLTAVVHLCLVLAILTGPATPEANGWLAIDPPGRVVLLLISVLFLICSFYTVGYLRYRVEHGNRIFSACLLTFLGSMSLVICTDNLGLMW